MVILPSLVWKKALLDIPSLWGGMKIGTLHKMMEMKYDEVSKPWRGAAAG